MPTSFVVKNGSRILLRFSSGMPQPVSAMRIATWLRVVQLRRDDDLALRLDGLRGIRDDVEEHLVDLRRRAFDLGNLAVELADGGFVLDDVLRDHQRLVEAGVDVEARDRRAVEPAEVLQALRHLRELAQARDAVAREVLNFLDGGFELASRSSTFTSRSAPTNLV